MNRHSIWKIIAKNTFTLFNLVNLILAIMVGLVGSYKNMLFIIIAIANTLISIINEVRAQKIVNKLKLLAEQNPTVIRNNKSIQVAPDQVQKGDVAVLSLGDQVLYDSILTEGQLEVNEAFISGEQDNIVKKPGDRLTSGSFVVAGTAKATVEHVGADNFVTKLQTEATSIKTADSKLFKLMNDIVKYISYALIPIGALLLWSRFRTEPDATEAVTSTVAALINMIPEGLILLTSSVLALATIRLSRKKVLVQDLYSIETLARVDTICLDKTGTITTGNMTVKNYTQLEKSFLSTLEAILSHQMSENATTTALKKKFLKSAKNREIDDSIEIIPFSSDRKYSGFKKGNTEYFMGAIEFLTDDKDMIKEVKSASGNYRTIAIVERGKKTKLLGYIHLEDEIRHDAKKIINYFYDNNVDIKIISGDELQTVVNIAKTVGIKDLNAVDPSAVKHPNYRHLVQEYSIFTRVRPAEKKHLIAALKKQGRTVAMTGDGVNDILAMKEADCSIAIGEGSDAARRSAKIVLLNSDFSAVPKIIDEGRQSINNLERSTSLFLAKTVYAGILAVVFVFLPFSYPFKPIEMSLLNFACIGFPGLILSLEKNTDRIKDRFVSNILTYSVPIGLTVSLCMVALAITAGLQNFSRHELSTTAVFITFVIDFILIYWISRPLNKLRSALLITIMAIMAIIFLWPFARDFFEFTFLTQNGLIASLIIIASGVVVFEIMRRLLSHFTPKILAKLER